MDQANAKDGKAGGGGGSTMDPPSTPGFSEGSGSPTPSRGPGMDPLKADAGVYVHFTTAVEKSEFLWVFVSFGRRVSFSLTLASRSLVFALSRNFRQHASRHARRHGSHGPTVHQGDGSHLVYVV